MSERNMKNKYGTLPDGSPGHKPGSPQNPYVHTASSSPYPNPGGYYEEPNALGRMFGVKRTWHKDDGTKLYDDEAQAEASKWLDSVPEPDIYPEDDEDQYGPDGPKMPRAQDLPAYTAFGQLLKRFSK